MSQNHIGDPDEKVSGMSQERTEPYTFTFDETEQMFMKFFVENSTHTLTVRGQQEAIADLLTARREIDRLNDTITGFRDAVWELAKENDRLNAVITDKDAQIEKQESFVEKSALAVAENETIEQYKESEIARLNVVIAGQASALREQTAKVQERDNRIEFLENLVSSQKIERERLVDLHHKQYWERGKEIERLRAAMVLARSDLTKIKDKEQDAALAAAVDWVIVGVSVALKGAE